MAIRGRPILKTAETESVPSRMTQVDQQENSKSLVHLGNPKSDTPNPNMLLVSEIDGSLHAIDSQDGRKLWTCSDLGGSLLKGTINMAQFMKDENAEDTTADSWALSREVNFLVEPVYPGSLYIYVPGDVIQRMPISIKNLVGQSPVRWSDGTVFLGKKTTQFFALDLSTGKVIFQFGDSNASGIQDFERFSHLPVIYLGRTDYHITAYRADSAPKNICFSEFSGIKNPQIMWKRTEDGQIIEFEPSLLNTREMALPDLSIYSAFDGTIYARDKALGQVKWAQKFNHPCVSVLKLNFNTNGAEVVPAGQPSEEPYQLFHVPISNIESEELPDESGCIGHPMDYVHTKEDSDSKVDSEIYPSDLVNIGDYDGTLFVLPHCRFPRFRKPKKSEVSLDKNQETGLIRKAPFSFNYWQHSCGPEAPDWPFCLTKSPQFVYEPPEIPLLESGNSLATSDESNTIKVIWSLVAGVFLTMISFFGTRFWKFWKIRRRPAASLQRPAPRQFESSQSSVRSRPPGFEEITLTSADFFYHVQGDQCPEDSIPKSFIVTDQVLGYGSHGTVVFKGQFDGRDVAVKRMLIDFYDMAGHEVNLLQQSDNHPNVIRYFCREQTDRFMYIVLELCPSSLADLIERRETETVKDIFPVDKPMEPRKILQEIMLGLEHLHSIKLVHRDLKPANILIAPTRKALLSDFGLSKKLADDQSSFHATVQSGTIGWRAPECILNDEVIRMKGSNNELGTIVKGVKITKAIDIFAAGCIFYYVLTGGLHPFGNRMQREINIVQNKCDLSELSCDPVALDLVNRMISRDPTKRPTASQVLAHPFFWQPSKRLSFLMDVSDHIERENRHTHPTNKALEACRSAIYNGKSSWSVIVDPIFWEDLSKFRKYFGNSVQDLLRAMRNKRHHFQELTPELKALLGESAEGYMSYFEKCFPLLLIQVYLVIEKSDYRTIHPFKDVYFSDGPE